MEQYLLQLPKRLAHEVRAGIAHGEPTKVDMVSGADNKHFTLHVNGKEYPAKIAQLPCIVETHKTYDDNFFYKSGEIGQIFVVTDKQEEKKLLETQEEVQSGLTPPNTNVIKRKYEKTKKTTPFPKADVARVEEDLVKIIAGGAVEDIHEELVDFYDWMADDEHPNGITVTDEMALIREHPEYLTLSEEPPTKQMRTMPLSAGNTTVSSTANTSVMNTPLATDAGSGTESQADGQRFLQRSPTFAPTSSPKLSPLELFPSTSYDQDEEKEVDMLEDDILNDLDTKPAMPSRQKAYLTDADYLNLLPIRERLQKSVRDLDRDMSGFAAKVDANSNIVVKNRFKQMLEAASKQRAEIVTELDKVNAKIVALETS